MSPYTVLALSVLLAAGVIVLYLFMAQRQQARLRRYRKQRAERETDAIVVTMQAKGF